MSTIWTGASVDDATKFAGSPVSTETELNALDEYFHSAPHVHAFVEHVEDDAYLESAATCTEPAAYYLSCECGEAGTDTFTVGAPLGHDWGDWEVVTPADCTDSGIEERVCASCQNKESREIPATGHSWGEPVWTWSEDMTEASATFTCSNNPSHTEVLTAEPTASVKAEPTCTESGQRVYSAAVELGGKKYDVTSTAEIPATGHDWGEPAWSWDDGYTKFVATFTCSNDPSHTEVLTAEPTASVKAEPTCTEAGVRVYTATVELDGTKCTATSEQAIPALGHDFRDGVCTVCEAKDSRLRCARGGRAHSPRHG